MKQGPLELLHQWMKGANSVDVEVLLSLYDPHVVLIPTFSSRVLNTLKKLRDYFEPLRSRPELSISLHEKILIVQALQK